MLIETDDFEIIVSSARALLHTINCFITRVQVLSVEAYQAQSLVNCDALR